MARPGAVLGFEVMRTVPGAARVALVPLLLAAWFFGSARAEDVRSVDWGHFNVSLKGTPIGAEQFSLDLHGDSLVVQGNAYEIMPRRDADGSAVTLQKQVG